MLLYVIFVNPTLAIAGAFESVFRDRGIAMRREQWIFTVRLGGPRLCLKDGMQMRGERGSGRSLFGGRVSGLGWAGGGVPGGFMRGT